MYALPASKRITLWITCILGTIFFSSHAQNRQNHPIRVWGSFSSIYQELEAGESNISSSNWLNIGTINASTYIWQPWFALINGSLSLTASESDSDLSGESESDTFNGSFQFNLFPTSRFPFVLYASRSQFEQDREINDRIFSQTTIGLRQSYTNLEGNQAYFLSYQRQERDSQTNNDDASETLTFGANIRLESHSFATNVSTTELVEDTVRDESDSALTIRHNYFGNSEVSHENQLSLSRFDDEFGPVSDELETNQFASFTSWRPNHSRDLIITGNLRLIDRTRTQITTATPPPGRVTEQQAANLNQGLVYRLNQNVTLQESVNATQNKQGSGITSTNYAETFSANYSSDTLDLSLGKYNWFLGSSLINQHGDVVESNLSLSTQAGHSLNREFQLSPLTTIQSNFAQNLNYTSSENGADTGTMGNAASFTWSDSGIETRRSMRFSATDTRSLRNSDNNQLFSLYVDYYQQLDRHTTIVTQATAQRSRTSSNGIVSGVRLLTANISYTDQRFLNQQGLIFRSQLAASDNEPDLAEQLNPDTQAANSVTWENELIYRIGLFESRLSLDYIKTDNDYNRIIIIELTRNFGDL